MKLDYRKLVLVGFGFFAVSIAWSVYNAFVPPILEKFGLPVTVIGMIMAIDNVFGIIFQPLFGSLSDRTHTKLGRRMPYILIGLPLCALLFALIPFAARMALWAMMLAAIAFNLIMSFWRSPVIALMPDITPSAERSKANGVINLMGGVGSIIAFLIGGSLSTRYGTPAPFIVATVVMLISWVLLGLFVREPAVRQEPEAKEKKKGFHALNSDEKKSLILILMSIFFWFLGYNAVETLFTVFAINTFGIKEGEAAMLLAFYSVAFVLFALPAGIIGGKIGRKKTILIGLCGIVIAFGMMIFLRNMMVFRILLVFGGLAWACVNINSLPMVVQLAGKDSVGTFTGYYYFFSVGAAVLSPTIAGWLIDISGKDYSMLFVYAALCMVLAIGSMRFVGHGEEIPMTTGEILEQIDK